MWGFRFRKSFFAIAIFLPATICFAPTSTSIFLSHYKPMQRPSACVSVRAAENGDEPIPMASSAFGTVYDRLGVAPDELAKGVLPGDVLEWLGTREEIVEKFRKVRL